MIPADTWFPVVTLLFGTVLGGVLEALRDRRAIAREAAARAETRAEVDRLRRLEFQQSTLLALQDSVTDLIRHIGVIHHHDLVSYRLGAAEKWGETPLPDKKDTDILATVQLVGKLRVRADDAKLRTMVSEITGVYSGVGLARSEENAEAILHRLPDLVLAFHERIGILIRGT